MRPCAQHACSAVLLGLILAGLAPAIGAEPSAQPVLTRVEQIRALSLKEAERGYPVHLKGVITYILPQAYMAFIADGTGEVYFAVQPSDRFGLVSGDEVQLDGKVSAGRNSPIVTEPQIQKLGHTELPSGTPIEMQQLADGVFDSQRVEIEGVVRSVEPDRAAFEGLNLYAIELGVEDRVVVLHFPDIPGGWNRLIDATVRASGVLASSVNGGSLLFSNLSSDVKVERLGPSDPFNAPMMQISELDHIGPGQDFAHRFRIRGVVVYDLPGSFFFISGDGANVIIATRQEGKLDPGDIVEVSGFYDFTRRGLGMVDASFRKIGSTSPPASKPLTDLTYISAEWNNSLAEVRGKLVSYDKARTTEILTLEEQGIIYQAFLPLLSGEARLTGLPLGSAVKLRGVAQVHDAEVTGDQSLDILLRSPEDVTVLDKGPWFNLQRLMILAAWLGGLVVAAVAWLLVLRRRIRQQTAIIAERLQKEAALERRYRKLFQIATDIIFSVSPDGAISSLNASAGAVLRPVSPTPGPTSRRRLNLLDMVSESTRQSTELWLRRVVAERSAPSFDLYIVSRHGGESIIEVSTSLAEDDNAKPVIECIARDVTSRKKSQQLETDRNRVLELVARRSPLQEILSMVENLLDRQIPNARCSIVVRPPQLDGDGMTDRQQPHEAEPGHAAGAFEGRDGSARLEITASDTSLLGWLCCAPGDSVTLEGDRRPIVDTAVNLAAVAIEHDLLNRKLIYQSHHDALTGLPNRLLFQDRLAQALIRARRQSWVLAVMYLDLDKFKVVNDQLGHGAGDILLVEVSRRLQAQLRESDSLARMGGDEFTLILPDLNSWKDAERVAAKLVESLCPAFLINGTEVFTSASVGISMYPEDSEDSSMLQKHADTAMYWVKSHGKSSYQFFKDLLAQAGPSGS